MRTSFLLYAYFYLWIAPHLLLLPLALLMFHKGLYKAFPLFQSYVLFEFLQFCILFALYIAQRRQLHLFPAWMYQTVDLLSRTGSIILHFGVLQELFESPVANNSDLRQTTGRILKWVTGLLIAMGLLFIGSLYYSAIGHRLPPWYATLEGFNIAQCGVLVFVFLWHRYLGLRMSPLVFGIALGIGMTACSDALIQAWVDSLAARNPSLPTMLQMTVFHLATFVWLYSAAVQKKS